jgi:hypothetical protein
MTCGARPGTGVPAASHPEAVQPWDTPAGGAPVLGTGRARPGSRRGRGWAWVLAAGVLAAAAVRAPGAAGDLRAAAGHLGGLRPAWLGVAVAAQGVALASGAAAQRQLLAAGGARLRWRTVFGLVLASTGLARVMPPGRSPVAPGRCGSTAAAAQARARGCGRC